MCLYNVAWVAKEKTGYKIMRRSWHTDDNGDMVKDEFFPMYGMKPNEKEVKGCFLGQTYTRQLRVAEYSQNALPNLHPTCRPYNGDMLNIGVKKIVSNTYPIGFHILPTKQDVLKYFQASGLDEATNDHAIIEVRYLGILAKGIDYTGQEHAQLKTQCVVAAQLTMVREVSLKELKKNLRKRKQKEKV